jgi:outer membrane receptor protein involved in Fe transport
LSTFKQNLSDAWDLTVGIDGRYYIGEHYRQLRSLLGGDYYVDDSDENNPNRVVGVGNKVAYHNDGLVRQFGGFGQIEYKGGAISAFLNVSASMTGFNRIDYFNFLESDPARETGYENIAGYTGKTGLNFNIDQHNNVFANVGFFSRAPIFDNVYDFANNKYQNIKNEKILGVEIGYGHNSPRAALLVNGYYTSWEDRAISRSVENDVTGEDFFFNIVGAKQRHVGGELQGRLKLTGNLEVEGSFSWAENKYTNDTEAYLAPEDDPNQIDTIQTFTKDLFVGDFPMTNASLGLIFTEDLSSGTSFYFNPVWRIHSRHYAQFNPDDRNDPDDRAQSWKIPDYYIIDVHAGFDILFTDFFFKKLSLALHIFNALDNLNYIVDAQDGSDHNSQTSRVFMGRDRWWNFSVGFEF